MQKYYRIDGIGDLERETTRRDYLFSIWLESWHEVGDEVICLEDYFTVNFFQWLILIITGKIQDLGTISRNDYAIHSGWINCYLSWFQSLIERGQSYANEP